MWLAWILTIFRSNRSRRRESFFQTNTEQSKKLEQPEPDNTSVQDDKSSQPCSPEKEDSPTSDTEFHFALENRTTVRSNPAFQHQ